MEHDRHVIDAGIDVSLNQIQLGHRTASGWIVDKMAANVQLKPDTFYNMLVAVNGLVVTVTLNNSVNQSPFGSLDIPGGNGVFRPVAEVESIHIVPLSKSQ